MQNSSVASFPTKEIFFPFSLMSITRLYLVGNAGVGKSFLCNCLLQEERFESKDQAASCTRTVEFADLALMDRTLRIYNIPGLLEADPERVKINAKLLQEALDHKDPAIMIYVLTTEGGRVRDSDYAAYNALKEAYNIQQHSFAFLVNKSTSRNDKNGITAYIHSLLADRRVEFLADFESEVDSKTNYAQIMESMRPTLLNLIDKLQAAEMKKISDIKLTFKNSKRKLDRRRRNTKRGSKWNAKQHKGRHKPPVLHNTRHNKRSKRLDDLETVACFPFDWAPLRLGFRDMFFSLFKKDSTLSAYVLIISARLDENAQIKGVRVFTSHAPIGGQP